MGDDNLSKYKKVTFENCLGFLDINLRLFRANLIFPNNAFPLTFFTVFFFAILNFCYGRKDFCKRIFCLQFLLNKHIHIRFWKLGTSFTFCRSLIAISVLKNMVITYKIIPLPFSDCVKERIVLMNSDIQFCRDLVLDRFNFDLYASIAIDDDARF